MRQNRSIVTLNLVMSLLLGVSVGVAFPFYVQLFGMYFFSGTHFFIFFLSCVITGAGVGLLAFVVNKITIIRIVKVINQELQDIAEGRGDLTRTLDINSRDELGQLASWFNTFVRGLDTMMGNSKKLANAMCENGIDFNISLRHTGDILKSVFSNLKSLEDFRTKQSQQQLVNDAEKHLEILTGRLSDASEHSVALTDSFKDFTHYVLKQSQLAQEFFSSVESLKHSLGDQNSGKTSDRGETHSDLLGVATQFAKESARSIDEQSQRFIRIEKLLEEIEDIAESTHLLSINASIEAARAGESGRGFTIVALQIRNLATNSGTLTSEIREQIEAIMNVTKNSGAHLADLRVVLNKYMENVIADMQQVMIVAKDISQTVTTINNMQRKLKEYIDNIGHGVSEVNVMRETLQCSMGGLGSYVAELNNSISHMSTGLDQIDKVAENFFTQGAAYEKQAQDLVKNMQNFRTNYDKRNSLQTSNMSMSVSNLGGTKGGQSFA